MLLRRQFRYCVTSLADVGEESITTQYYSFLSSLGGLVVERLNCSICTTQKFHLLFVVLLERRDKKIIFFSFLHAFRFISLTMIKITDTLMKKGLTRSLMWGHLAHLFVGCSSRTSVSFFGSFWGRRSYWTTRSSPEKEHETGKERLWVSISREETWQGAFVLVFHQSFPFFVYLSKPA